MGSRLSVKRVYEPVGRDDGMRILVDRLWPRGLSKADAKIDLWLKDIAPSHTLRKRFHGKPDDWDAFLRAYVAELKEPAAQQAVATLREKLREYPVTLLFAAKDEKHNNAVALLAWLKL